MKRSVLILLILLLAPWVATAQSVWQGSCAVGSYSSFPSTGLYGASNSFPQNTLVTVENSKTKQKANVLIIDRLDNNDLFMLLSRDAGKAIGLSPDEVGQVSVTLASRQGGIARGPGDLPYSTDPDIFPPAAAGNASSLSFLQKYLQSSKAPIQPAAPETAQAQPQPTPPEVSKLTPQQTPQGAAAGPPPPAPELAQSTTPTTAGAQEKQQAGSPPQPSVAAGPQPAQPQPTSPAGAASQEVPSPSGVQGGVEPTTPTATPSGPPAAPVVSPPATGGPVVTQLAPARTPHAVAPAIAGLATPAVPGRPGGPPVVSELQQAAPPSRPAQLALSGGPALPEIRSPGPTVSTVAQAAPPPSELPSAAMALPSTPSQSASGPQISQLAQAAPSVEPFVPRVSAVPTVPAPPTAVAAAPPSGPMVSALAGAHAPSSSLEVAQAALPSPSLEGFTPEVSRLAAGAPPAQPTAKGAAVPAPELAQAQQPSTKPPAARIQPTAPERQPSRPAPETPRPPSVAEAPAATGALSGLSTAAGAVHMVGRIPVRPSTALAPSSYYVQLGVYADSKAAVALADNLSPDYPVSVYAFEQAKKPLYKVMIGPLNSDESGTLLYLFIAQGYSDAFVRKGE